MTRRSVTFTKSEEPSSDQSDRDHRWDNNPPEELRIIEAEYAEAFEPLLVSDARFQGAKGGRGGAKSHFFAEQLIDEAIDTHIRCACLREVQASIKDSVKQLLEDKIVKLGVEDLFDVTDNEIRGPNDSLFIFRGMRKHTAHSIKSLEGFNRAWVEEAQTVSQRSLDLMIPTFRSGSKLRFSWNPNLATDPIDVFFQQNFYEDSDPDFICIHVNYDGNPWFPDELRRDMERDKKRDPEKYQHVWLGQYVKNSEARVFKNWQVEAFNTPSNVVFWLHGADWGFSVDPTVLIRGFVGRWENGQAIPDPKGKNLFIDHECYKVGVELDHTPLFFDQLVKERNVPIVSQLKSARQWPIIADSSNPQAISFLRRNGYPKIQAAVKGPNSIKEGVLFLQSYDIIVHPRCIHTIDELTHFSYKVDPLTDLVTPVLSDKKNHVIDSLRYMVEPIRKPRAKTLFGTY